MRQYTGSSFSFWYPAAWTVKRDKPAADPTDSGYLRGGRVVERLSLTNPVPEESVERAGVNIEEIHIPTGTLTEMGKDDVNPVGRNMHFAFRLGTRSTGDAGTTIGGLPIDFGARRHGAEVIVPLDRTHFLSLSTNDPGGDMNHLYVAQTIVARGLHPANPSDLQQQDAAHLEALKLGLAGQSIGIGYWHTDGQHVYNSAWKVIPGADPATLVPVSNDGPGAFFAQDGVHVYTSAGAAIPGADPKTFAAIGPDSAKDAHHSYRWRNRELTIDARVFQN